MSTTGYVYSGTELDVFALARNRKRYCGEQLAPYIRVKVLEAGAGIGTNSLALQGPHTTAWYCLEPDGRLLERLKEQVASSSRVPTEARHGTLADIAAERRQFDTILYIDVLEHIEDDASEIRLAASCLRPRGRLVVLAPAHQWLHAPFDAAIGHYRRYNRRMFERLPKSGLRVERIWYLDSAGLSLSLANRVLLKQAHPRPEQIRTWDRFFVPLSRILDPLFGYRFGKTVVGVW